MGLGGLQSLIVSSKKVWYLRAHLKMQHSSLAELALELLFPQKRTR